MRSVVSHRLLVTLLSLALPLTACNPPTSGEDTGTGDTGTGGTDAGIPEEDTGAGEDVGTGPACEHAVACTDDSISMLMLQATVATGAITEEGASPGETTHIDATAGGFGGPPTSFIYARFTETGLVRVDISDEDALESADWDIAFRRFVIRLNSGVSGPSCVTAGRTAPGTTFEGLTTFPDDVELYAEEYFTGDTCEFLADATGMGPQTVLSSYFTYSDCLAMSGNVYAIELADGRHVKLEVLAYYDAAVQESCNDGMGITMPSGSGNVRIRWGFLED